MILTSFINEVHLSSSACSKVALIDNHLIRFQLSMSVYNTINTGYIIHESIPTLKIR